MPSRSKDATRVVHTPLPPPKRQQRFPERRKVVKARASLPKLRKDQSTLTQLDFVSSPSMNNYIVPESSEDEYEATRPKKRRRKSKLDEKERGQSTLTQILPGGLRQPLVDDDGFEIWQDYGSAEEDHEEQAQVERHPRTPSKPRSQQAKLERILEIPETSQLAVKSSPRADSGIEYEIAETPIKPGTPPKQCFHEIPSCQTPPNVKKSTLNPPTGRPSQRSPLKERNINTPAQKTSSSRVGSQKVETYGLDTRVLASPRASQIKTAYQSAAIVDVHNDANVLRQQKPRRKLRRATTIQDSQQDDGDVSEDAVGVLNSPVKPPADDLTRVTAVDDSQADGAEIPSRGATVIYQETSDEATSQAMQLLGYNADTQLTYDPVQLGLDRDASRFKWTQTQRAMLSDVAEEQEYSDLDEDDDLDRGCVQEVPSKVVNGRREPANVGDVHSSELDVPPAQAIEHSNHPHRTPERAGAEVEKIIRDTTPRPVEIIPSSPPALVSDADLPSSPRYIDVVPLPPVHRPATPQIHPEGDLEAVDEVQTTDVHDTILSEASTILTCSSSKGPERDHSRLHQTSTDDNLVSEASTIPPYTSPVKPRSGTQQSPLDTSIPLPPWDSSGNEALGCSATSNALDWSLPPPPSMASTEPASSSR
jgi:hypothetical protein